MLYRARKTRANMQRKNYNSRIYHGGPLSLIYILLHDKRRRMMKSTTKYERVLTGFTKDNEVTFVAHRTAEPNVRIKDYTVIYPASA